MVELVALEPDLRAAKGFCQAFGKIQRAGAADIVFEEVLEFGGKGRVGFRFLIGFFQREDVRHQGFGDIAAAEFAKAALRVRVLRKSIGFSGHGRQFLFLPRSRGRWLERSERRRGDEAGYAIAPLVRAFHSATPPVNKGRNMSSRLSHIQSRTAFANALIFAVDFTPGALSMPDETSTAVAPDASTAARTLAASSPPDKSQGVVMFSDLSSA